MAKGKRGRPKSTGTGKTVGVRILPPLMKRIDGWSKAQDDKPQRPEAIRRLTEMGLNGDQRHPSGAHKGAAAAKAFAKQQLDALIHPDTPDEERQNRKRRLLKGPSEFRDIRKDHGK